MSAPWASMWVAHECRSACGLTGRLIPASRARPATMGISMVSKKVEPTAPPADRFHGSPPEWREPVVQRRRAHLAHRDDALLRALAEQADQSLPVGQVGQVEADRLADPGAGAVQELEERAVAARRRVPGRDGPKQSFDLFLAQRLREPAGQLRSVELRGRIIGRPVLVDQEVVQAAQHRLRASDRRRAVVAGPKGGQVVLDVPHGRGEHGLVARR